MTEKQTRKIIGLRLEDGWVYAGDEQHNNMVLYYDVSMDERKPLEPFEEIFKEVYSNGMHPEHKLYYRSGNFEINSDFVIAIKYED